MKLLRIKLRQNKAHYGRPECVDNRMTYPLPPYSTVIGALHAACGYKNYHPMNISIQGKYQHTISEAYTIASIYNSIEDDRGTLIYLTNNAFSNAYIKIAEAARDKRENKKASFKSKEQLNIFNEQLLDEYNSLKKIEFDLGSNRIDEEKCIAYIDFLNSISDSEPISRINQPFTSTQLKKLASENKITRNGTKYIFSQKEQMKLEFEKILEIKRKLKSFAALYTDIKKRDVLINVELILHIEADESTISDILSNRNNFVCLGRSEDFVEICETKIVEATDEIDKEFSLKNMMYINRNAVKNLKNCKGGTVYYLPKKYHLSGSRQFDELVKALLTSDFAVSEKSDGILVDEDGYIVNLN